MIFHGLNIIATIHGFLISPNFLPLWYFTQELQRMFEHSNIIRLRFSRTNFFHERTFVDARWFIFGSKSAELRRSRASTDPCSSCNLALPRWRLSPDRLGRNGNMTFQLEQRMKDYPSKVSNTYLVAGIWNNQPVLHRGDCVLWPQASSDPWYLSK